MKEISWGNLPRYFFKEYNTGLSINAVAIACRAELMRKDFPPLPCIEDIKPPQESSSEFLSGFETMKRLCCNNSCEKNPMSFLTKAIYNAICCQSIDSIEFIFTDERLQTQTAKIAAELASLQSIAAQKNISDINTQKLIIVIDAKNTQHKETPKTLYGIKQKLLKSKQANIIITLPEEDEYRSGILYALLAASAIMLKSIAEINNKDCDII